LADSIKRTFAVGLTGGIASGKSAVARRFAALEIRLLTPMSWRDKW